MKFLRKQEVAELVGYHPVHIMRLAKAGDFPQPVRVGAGRTAFVESEIQDWMASRVAARDGVEAEPDGG